MDYYRGLNLEREPFSNSPDPGLFFNSKQHLEALQNLEISIRLKRGLNVVTGDVGTGKTTISRQLVKRISNDPELGYFLVLDPGFNAVTDFLGYVLNLFTGEGVTAGDDENSLKEKIKRFLFSRGVDGKATTVLIIDEGQKLPGFCLEALRELLNYETNAEKLLQIVIFAQNEFDKTVSALENFKDRINFRYALGPLNFRETRGMIRYRLDRSAVPGNKGALFSFGAYFAVYRLTRGYPRKIINLCHRIILALIIKNRSRAGWFLVRSCGMKVFPEKRVRPGVKSVFAVFLLLAVGHFFFPLAPGRVLPMIKALQERITPAKTIDVAQATAKTEENADSAVSGGRLSVAEVPESLVPSAVEQILLSQIYGRLKVSSGVPLYRMIESVYGSFNPDLLGQLLKANPVIEDPDRIWVGMVIAFPVLDPSSRGWNDGTVCIVFSKHLNFRRAYGDVRQYRAEGVDARLLPVGTNGREPMFLVVVDQPFSTMGEARVFQQQMSTTFASRCTRLTLAGSSETLP